MLFFVLHGCQWVARIAWEEVLLLQIVFCLHLVHHVLEADSVDGLFLIFFDKIKQKLAHNTANTPNIDRKVVLRITKYNLRCPVYPGTDLRSLGQCLFLRRRLRLVPHIRRRYRARQAEVTDLYVALRIDEDVGGLQVTMDDVGGVQVVDGAE